MQLDTRGVGQDADIDLGQGEPRLFGRKDKVAGNGEFKAAANGNAVNRRDHELVEIRKFLQAAKSPTPKSVSGVSPSAAPYDTKRAPN